LELLDLLEARGLNYAKTWSLKKFAYRILQVGKSDIDARVKEVWKMRFRPIDEVIYDIHMRDAREAGLEEGMEIGMEKGRETGRKEGIEIGRKIAEEEQMKMTKNLLIHGFDPVMIAESSGLALDKIQKIAASL
jgi:hypothetical protein